MSRFSVPFCLAVCFLLCGTARANFVLNGDFESPIVGGPFQTLGVGSTGITSWTVISGVNDPGGGSVDLYHGGAPAYSGQQMVDLDGTGGQAVGGISQNITGLTIGSVYSLDFFFANNPVGSSASALVTIGDLSQTISHSGSTFSAMNYTEATFTFTATNTVLSFTSTDPSGDQNGIMVDDVSILTNTVPEPASVFMLGIGSLGLFFFARRRRV